jgi:hypothetical protein
VHLKLLELRQTVAIEIVNAHFYSMTCFSFLLKLLQTRERSESDLKVLGLDVFGIEGDELDLNFTDLPK